VTESGARFQGRRFALVVLAIGLGVACAGCKRKSIDPFPATGAVAGWEKTDDTRVYAAKDLWQYIDGDAEQYLQAGVVSTSTSDYKYQGRLDAVVDVFTMGNSEGARKILEAGGNNDAQSVQIGDAGIAYAQSVTFRRGSFLVRIVAYEGGPGTQQALIGLAHGVEARL